MTSLSLFTFSCTGEGNGNPLQCSCLENPRNGGAWWAAVYGVAQSWTRLKRLSSSSRRKKVGRLLSIINEGLSPGLRNAPPLEQSYEEGLSRFCGPSYGGHLHALLCLSLCPSTGEVPAHFVCNWSRVDLTAER